jgi:hypothetical protein
VKKVVYDPKDQTSCAEFTNRLGILEPKAPETPPKKSKSTKKTDALPPIEEAKEASIPFKDSPPAPTAIAFVGYDLKNLCLRFLTEKRLLPDEPPGSKFPTMRQLFGQKLDTQLVHDTPDTVILHDWVRYSARDAAGTYHLYESFKDELSRVPWETEVHGVKDPHDEIEIKRRKDAGYNMAVPGILGIDAWKKWTGKSMWNFVEVGDIDYIADVRYIESIMLQFLLYRIPRYIEFRNTGLPGARFSARLRRRACGWTGSC